MTKDFFSRSDVNIDIGFRCALECPNCQRSRHYTKFNNPVRGYDLSLDEFLKVASHFKSIHFCGQFSDPVHHPKFIEFLEICFKKNIEVHVHNASSAKSKDWYKRAFQTNPDALWWFGIDGLPHQSHLYRINQDGNKLFDIMIESKKYLKKSPIWQYIVFRYNEDNVEEAKKIAEENEVSFNLVISSRWNNSNDPLIPTKKEYRMSLK